jgi:uncharacterized membrane-anchored protein
MRFGFALAAVLLQLVILVYMAGERENVIRNGRPILLRTAPIDPNDPMRGDYVRLDYDISNASKESCRDGVLKMFPSTDYVYTRQWRDTRVYAVLKWDAAGLAQLDHLTDQRPAAGIFIRGRIDSFSARSVRVRYGIEAYFMQQGVARKLEDTIRNDRPGVPLNMKIALGDSGIAVLQDHIWEPLGIAVAFDRLPNPEAASQPADQFPRQTATLLVGLTVTLKNYGTVDLAIVDLPKGESFRLVPDTRWNEVHYRGTEPSPGPSLIAPDHVIVLKPGQTHTTKIDLRESRWFVTDTQVPLAQQKPVALSAITTDAWSARFRLEYTPPSADRLKHLPQAVLVRPGSLRTRAFNPVQGVD